MRIGRLARKLGLKNLLSDRFGTLCAVLGVALGTATVDVVLTLDLNTRAQEARRWETNPDLPVAGHETVTLRPYRADGTPLRPEDAKEETHEDYQVMRSAIRLGSLSAFLVGGLIVFFTFRVVIEERRREIALLRSLGATARQVAQIFVFEALVIGLVGAGAGLIASVPMSILAALAGITTTGRAQLVWLWFPWKTMGLIFVIGALTAVLGVLRPLKEVLALDVAKTLRLEAEGELRASPRGIAALALPFLALLYVLIRPFFAETLPSLAFFVLEAGLVCAGFASALVLVPPLVGTLGSALVLLIPRARAARLIAGRRLGRAGHEVAWAVSGVMMVFALLLALHVVTHALKREVSRWAQDSIRGNAYVFVRDRQEIVPEEVLDALGPEVSRVRFTGRTPWPNALMAVDTPALQRFAALANSEAASIVSRLGPGKILLSRMMARRFGIGPGDYLEVVGASRTARLEVVGISDIAYVPMIGPYRDSKTFGVVDLNDADLLATYARPLGAGYALRHVEGEQPPKFWEDRLERARRTRGLGVERGEEFERYRLEETNGDFALFDFILLLTAVLAAVGIANHLVLSAHVRRREFELYRVLGMTAGQVRGLFLIEGALVGALGGAMAVVLGIPLGALAIGALRVVSAFEVEFVLPLHYAALTFVGAVLTALGGALYPAVRAGKRAERSG